MKVHPLSLQHIYIPELNPPQKIRLFPGLRELSKYELELPRFRHACLKMYQMKIFNMM